MEKLKQLREERGLSQVKLAARADLNPATVNQIERGMRDASPGTLRKLADALEVSLYELMEEEAPKVEPPLPFEDAAAGVASLDDLDANTLAELSGELDEELERVKATEAEELKQEHITEIRERRDEVIAALNRAIHRPGPPRESEVSAQLRRRKASRQQDVATPTEETRKQSSA